MFKAVKETDKYGRQQTKYYLTQGDSLVIYSQPYRDGEPLSLEQVEKCVFKISDSSYNQELEKPMTPENDRFVLRLESDETRQLAVDTHIYEIEYTLIGGAVQTPNQWKFIVLEQINT